MWLHVRPKLGRRLAGSLSGVRAKISQHPTTRGFVHLGIPGRQHISDEYSRSLLTAGYTHQAKKWRIFALPILPRTCPAVNGVRHRGKRLQERPAS